MRMKTIKELEAEKKNWDNLIKIWNNKKLDEEESERAEKEIDRLTDMGRGEIELDVEIKALKDVLGLIDEITIADCMIDSEELKSKINGQEDVGE